MSVLALCTCEWGTGWRWRWLQAVLIKTIKSKNALGQGLLRLKMLCVLCLDFIDSFNGMKRVLIHASTRHSYKHFAVCRVSTLWFLGWGTIPKHNGGLCSRIIGKEVTKNTSYSFHRSLLPFPQHFFCYGNWTKGILTLLNAAQQANYTGNLAPCLTHTRRHEINLQWMNE